MDKPPRETEAKPSRAFSKSAKRSVPNVPLDAERFTKFHLLTNQGEYDQLYLPIMRRYCANPPANFRMLEILDAQSSDCLYNVQRVGHLYGWDRRQKYQPDNIDAIDEMMARDSTRLFIFQVNGEDAGFCLVTAVADPVEQSQGAKKTDILTSYKCSHRLPAKSSAVEIYKFGLYDEFTGEGYGHHFLAKVLHQLFTKSENDIVYLDTRSTNHAGVLKFYDRNGIKVHLQEDLFSDLIEGPAPNWEPTNGKKVIVPNGHTHGPNGESNDNAAPQ